MLLQRLFCLAVLLIFPCLADRNYSICEDIVYSCGPVPPTLPESFIMKGLKVNLATNDFLWFEEYFDPENLRGKYVEISKGQEIHRIFDYHTQQIISYFDIHPGADIDKNVLESMSCRVEAMSNSKFTDILGKKFGYYDPLRPRMYSSYESLRYGGPYSFAYDETDTRAKSSKLSYMTFKGCVYDDNEDATYSVTFRWTDNITLPAFGMSPFPIVIEENGGYNTKSDNGDIIWNPVKTYKNIAWFESNPYMAQDNFQPPVRMDCPNMISTDTVILPSLPDAFSTRMETFIITENYEGNSVQLIQDKYQEIWYDSARKLVRHDYLPTLAEELLIAQFFDTMSMVTAVHDFNTGLSFYTDKVQGLCVTIPTPNDLGDRLVLSRSSTEKNVVMASPQEVFSIENKLRFKGKYTMRGIRTDGYSARVDRQSNGGTVSILHEIYFTTDGWHEEVEGQSNYDIPVVDIEEYSTKFEGQDAFSVSITNYYKFMPTSPSLSIYDISSCALGIKKKYFKVDLSVDKKPEGMTDAHLADRYSQLFLYSAQTALTEGADLGSPLRIQDIQTEYLDEGKIGLSFTILDILSEKPGSVSSPQNGQSLDAAIATLTTKINTGTAVFTILTDPRTSERAEFLLVPKSLREIKKRVFYEVLPGDPPVTKESSEPGHSSSESHSNQDKRANYSKGALAGLAIGMLVLGFAVGGAIMLIYFKKFMKSKSDTETANFVLAEST